MIGVVSLSLALVLAHVFISDVLGKTSSFHAMQEFMHSMQLHDTTVADCKGLSYVISDMGCGGGFAAHMQLAASQWLRAAHLVNYSMPVIIMGHILRYSEVPECAHVGQDWTCYFESMVPASCQNELLKSGKQIQVDINTISTFDDALVPLELRSKRVSFRLWWGYIQHYMFRMQPKVLIHIHMMASKMPVHAARDHLLNSRGPLAGLHVRHGDKASDGFKHHSFADELTALSKSPECVDVVQSKEAPTCRVTNSSSPTNDSMSIITFVASDDPHVVFHAQELGYLVSSQGVSQHTGQAGMFKALNSHPEMGYEASLEIITDIYLLSRCSSLVGIAASQVYRLAVGISTASGKLKHAVAMDIGQLGRIHAMSNQYRLPVPEVFAGP